MAGFELTKENIRPIIEGHERSQAYIKAQNELERIVKLLSTPPSIKTMNRPL